MTEIKNEVKVMIGDAIIEIEDNLEKIKIDQETANTKMQEISEAYLSKAMERTVAHYFEAISDRLQRELCQSIVHNPTNLQKDSTLQKLYQTEDSLQLKNSAELLAGKIEAIGLNLVANNKFKTSAQKQLKEL